MKPLVRVDIFEAHFVKMLERVDIFETHFVKPLVRVDIFEAHFENIINPVISSRRFLQPVQSLFCG